MFIVRRILGATYFRNAQTGQTLASMNAHLSLCDQANLRSYTLQRRKVPRRKSPSFLFRLATPPCPHTPMLKPFLIIFHPRFNIGLGGTGPRNPIHNRGTFLRWTMAVHIRAYLQKKRTRKQTIKDEFRVHVKLSIHACEVDEAMRSVCPVCAFLKYVAQ